MHRLIAPVLLFTVSLAGCTPSMTDRVARDVARAFADSEFRRTSPYDNRSTVSFMAAHPAIRRDAMWLSHNVGYSVGYALGRLMLP